MKIAMVTLGTPEVSDYAELVIPNKQNYCDKHGYTFHYFTESLDTSRHPVWSKIPAILQVLEDPEIDWVFWTDMDAIVVDDSIKLESFIDDTHDFIFSLEPDITASSIFQASHFFCRNTQFVRDFLHSAYRRENAEPRGLHEQSALQEEYRDNHSAYGKVLLVPSHFFNSGAAFGGRCGFIRHYGSVITGISSVEAIQRDLVMLVRSPRFKRREDLVSILHHHRLFGKGAEIGVAHGYFSEHILRNWWGDKLYSIDAWEHNPEYVDGTNYSDQAVFDKVYAEAVSLLSPFGNRSEVIRMTSRDAALKFDDGELDFVYIDARHDKKGITEDLALWEPKVRSGGIVAGHDFLDGVIGGAEYRVRPVVTEWAAKRGYRLHLTSRDNFPSWYVVKQ